MPTDQIVNVRYMVDDVAAAIDFYANHFDFTPQTSAPPAFADVTRGTCDFCCLVLKAPPGVPCPTVNDPTLAGGTASTS